jgi:hypothetical protein
MKTQSMLKTLAVMISLEAFTLISCTSQSTAEAPAPEPFVEASATEFPPDDTGFTADGEFRDGVLYHGGYVFYRER